VYSNRADVCTCVQTSNITKVSVQDVLSLLEYKLEDVDATVWSLQRWTPGGNVPTLRSGATSADRRHEAGCNTHAPTVSPKCHGPAPYFFSGLNTL